MQTINVSNPDDHLGTVLRNAMIICNANFTELSQNKADLVAGKIAIPQLPVNPITTVSINPPSGTPNNGDVWIRYID